MSDIEKRRPKLAYRMQKEKLDALRAWAEREGISVTAVLNLLVTGLLDGDIRLTALQAWTANTVERTEPPPWAQPPVDMGEQ